MATISQTTTTWSSDFGNDSQHYVRQKFTTGSPLLEGTASEATVYLSKSGSPSGTISIKHKSPSTSETLFSLSASGLGESATGYSSTFTNDFEWGNDHWLEIDLSDITSGYVNVHGDNSDPTSNATASKQNSAGSWEEISGVDLAFSITYSTSGGGSGGGGSGGGGEESSSGSISGTGGPSPSYAMRLNIGYIR